MILTLKKLVIYGVCLLLGLCWRGVAVVIATVIMRDINMNSRYIPSRASYARKDETYTNNYVRRSKSLPIDTISKYIEDQKNSVYVML